MHKTPNCRPLDDRVSLLDAIGHFHRDFSRLESLLVDARCEIVKLKRELAKSQSNAPLPAPEIDLHSLRRHVMFKLHPDRGGDTIIMQQFNQLFDFLQRSQVFQGATQ